MKRPRSHQHTVIELTKGDRTVKTRHTYKGVYYFFTYAEAKRYAEDHELPTDRIRFFIRGWAIQLRISGPYAGPQKRPSEVYDDKE